MKLNPFALALLSATFAAASASATQPEDALLAELKDKFVPLLVGPHHHLDLHERKLQDSDTCAADFNAVYSNPEFQSAFKQAVLKCPSAGFDMPERVSPSNLPDNESNSSCFPQYTETVTKACTAANGE